jgi:hypothetical protein
VDGVAALVAVGIVALPMTGGTVLSVVLAVVADGPLVVEGAMLGALEVVVLVTLGDRTLTELSVCAAFEALAESEEVCPRWPLDDVEETG